MPTISSLRSNPSLTPCTMLATNERVSPCSARTSRWSEARSTVSTLPSILIETPDGIDWDSLPLGPSTLTVLPSTPIFTPCGIMMGFLPILDMVSALLPHVREHFAAQLLLATFPVCHDTTRRGEDRHTHTTEDRRDLVLADVDPPSRSRHPHEAGDHLLVPRAILQIDAQRALLRVLDEPVVLDEAFLFQQLGDLHLELGGRDVDFLMLGAAGVADARQ